MASSDWTASMVPACIRAKKLRRGHELVGIVKLDFHLAIRCGVESVNLRLDHMRAERCSRIGLEAPLDGALGAHNGGCCQRRGGDCCAADG